MKARLLSFSRKIVDGRNALAFYGGQALAPGGGGSPFASKKKIKFQIIHFHFKHWVLVVY